MGYYIVIQKFLKMQILFIEHERSISQRGVTMRKNYWDNFFKAICK